MSTRHPTTDVVTSHPQPSDPGLVDVPLVRWPTEAALRHGLATLHRPRLLVIEPGVAPPTPIDDLEDWVRSTADPEDIEARSAVLRRRGTHAPPAPELDEDGLLRRGDEWVAISQGQAPVLRLLLDHFGRVVPMGRITETYLEAGGTGTVASVRTVLSRLGTRIEPLGLELVTIRRRGVILSDLQRGGATS